MSTKTTTIRTGSNRQDSLPLLTSLAVCFRDDDANSETNSTTCRHSTTESQPVYSNDVVRLEATTMTTRMGDDGGRPRQQQQRLQLQLHCDGTDVDDLDEDEEDDAIVVVDDGDVAAAAAVVVPEHNQYCVVDVYSTTCRLPSYLVLLSLAN